MTRTRSRVDGDGGDQRSEQNSAARVSAGLGAVGLSAVFVGLGIAPRAPWIEPVGALTHLALLPLVAGLRAPAWAVAMGNLWLGLDTTLSLALINGAPHELAFAFRLGGHVLAAVWIAAAAVTRDGAIRWVGAAAAVALGSHSFIAPLYAPPILLLAAGPLLVLWLALIAGTRLEKSGRLPRR